MAHQTREGVAPLYRAAERIVQEGLRTDGSLFTPGRAVWSAPTTTDLYERFVLRPDEGSDNFETKFRRQLAGAPADTIQLAAELLYLHFLITTQIKGSTKRAQIQTVLSWSVTPVEIPEDLAVALDHGICNAGQGFLRFRPFILAYLVEFLRTWKGLTAEARDLALADPWRFKSFVYSIPSHAAKSQQHALLHLTFPETFESIVSDVHKERIAEHFSSVLPRDGEPDVDRFLLRLRDTLAKTYGVGFNYYSPALKAQWAPAEDEGTGPQLEVPSTGSQRRYWVEKTLVAGRPDRMTAGPWAFGQAIWCPQRGEDGRDVYRLMRDVRPDDVVLHFTDNRAVTGVSVVASEAETDGVSPPDTAWSGKPSIRYALRDYTPLQPPIAREELFLEPGARARILEILHNHRGLFFNRELQLNQGSYLTEAPTALLKLLDDIYRDHTGLGLPHVDLSGVVPGVGSVIRDADSPTRALTMAWLEEQTLWPQERLLEVIDALQSKMPQVILAGPPGTGKTWIAQLLARCLTQDRPTHHRLVQFHPSYAYETFMQGLRPVSRNGAIEFQVVQGVVPTMAAQMRGDDSPYVLVIDEMNRANLPKVLGELMYLLEYRDHAVDLPFSPAFRLPPNLRFIGTMNTADRSIRSLDVALRRRFDIFECAPDPELLRRYFETRENGVPSLVEGLEKLNADLTAQLDRHHTIGHTFFMTSPMTPDVLLKTWRRKIGPLLEEYFFDQPDVAAQFVPATYWPELQD